MASFESIMKKFLESYEKQTEEEMVKEFMTLKSQSQKYKESNRYPAEAGQLPVNKKKNRFKDILPFEYTRVELHPIEGVEGSDYINANYVLGADSEIHYIAAQGPLPNTLDDFWRMLWYHNIEIVVMACREVEMGKNKCERYWPQVGKSMDFGAITVSTTFEENVSNDFVIRDLTAECQGEKQVIRQYHYNAWPDHGKPNSPDPIIRMIEMIENYRKQTEVPVVVHCSAGCGRTGTLIGIDVAKNMLLSKNVPSDFSVFKIVEKMRQQRPAMVQAKDQYLFVYMAIAELAKRSLGFNPTLPPKPANKPAVPAGKGYMNLDTNTPMALSNSRSPTPNSPPPLVSQQESTTDDHTYENVNNQPPLPTHKRHSQNETPDSLPEVPSSSSERLKLPAKPKPRNKSSSSPSVSPPQPAEKPPPREEVAVSSSQPIMPKPRPRNKPSRNSSDNVSITPIVTPPSPSETRAAAHSSITNRPNTPTKPELHPRNTGSATPEKALRPKSPDMSRRPLPVPPTNAPLSRTPSPSTSPQKSPVHKSPRKVSVELDSTYSLMAEEEDTTAVSPAGKNTSIMDTFKDILGEELMHSIEKKSDSDLAARPLPSLPPPRDRDDSLDEPPPAVPQRTDARLELVDADPVRTNKSVVAPTYDVPNDGKDAGGKSHPAPSYPAPSCPPSLPPSVPPTLPSSVDMDYEQPAPFSSLKIPSVNPPASSSHTPSSGPPVSNTFSRGSSSHGPGRGGGKIGRFFKSKKDQKKKSNTADDIGDVSSSSLHMATGSVTLPVRLSSRGPTEMSVDEKYKFPGRMGFGIRLDRPTGPREEPHHWKAIAQPSAIHVA